MMQVGVSSLHLIGKPFNSLLIAIQTYGANVWEIVDDDTLTLNDERARKLLDLKRSFGIDYTVHAPFADINIAAVNESFRRMTIERLKESLKYARKLEAKLWVFHPGTYSGLSFFYPQRDLERCVASVKELSKVADVFDVPIVIENMPDLIMFLLRGTDDFRLFYQLAGSDAPDMVLDIGHANTTNNIMDFFDEQGERIVHLHIHDNDGKVDSHNRMGDGTVPWKVVASRLDKSGFDGSAIIESVRDLPESIESARQLLL
jgi:sugar phosphate isomerase/epimerase